MALSTHTTLAQIGKGAFAGANMGFKFTGESSWSKFPNSSIHHRSGLVAGPKNYDIQSSIGGGYFLKDNKAVGLMLNYNTGQTQTVQNRIDTINTFTRKHSEVGFSVFGRCAKPLGQNNTLFFITDLSASVLMGQVNYVFEEKRNNFEPTKSKFDGPNTYTYIAGIKPGILFFPKPKIGLEANLGNLLSYKIERYSNKGFNVKSIQQRSTLEILNLSSLSLNVGINYYFKR